MFEYDERERENKETSTRFLLACTKASMHVIAIACTLITTPPLKRNAMIHSYPLCCACLPLFSSSWALVLTRFRWSAQKRLSRRKNQYYHHVGGIDVFALLFPSGKCACCPEWLILDGGIRVQRVRLTRGEGHFPLRGGPEQTPSLGSTALFVTTHTPSLTATTPEASPLLPRHSPAAGKYVHRSPP